MATVLIVDDTKADRMLLATLLRHQGHTVLEAGDGRAGLEMVTSAHPDLVVSDMIMPRMDGFEFARWVRNTPDTASTRVMFWTANTIDQERTALAKDCGVDLILQKPTEPEEMVRAVAKALGAEAPPAVPPSEDFERQHTSLLTDALHEKVEMLKEANASLREREAKLRLILDQLPGALWTTDSALIVTSIAGKAVREMGVDPTGVIGLGVGELEQYEYNKSASIRAHEQAFAGTPTSFELLLGDRWFMTFVEPLEGAGGTPTGTIGLALDMTDRKKTEDEREKMTTRLAMAERLESLGRLAGGVAHDFNNVLAVILNYAELIASQPENGPGVTEDVGEIMRAAQHGASLTRKLLMFGRREIAHPEVLDLNAVVTELRELLQSSIGEGMTLAMDLAGDLWKTKADPTGVEQLVVNLVVNARDAISGAGRIVITTDNVDIDQELHEATGTLPPGPYARLTVADTGAGMTPEVLSRAFEPFFTTKAKGEGTGLGLATVHGIVVQAGGEIRVCSAPGVGTTMRVYLPGAVQEIATPVSKAEQMSLEGEGETVLVVEDDQQVREPLVRVLSRRGYRVLWAKNALDALTVAVRHDGPLHLLLTDVVMPQMSGRELAERLRAKRPEMRVLFMSGYPKDVLDADTMAEFRLLDKPFSLQSLLNALREVLAEGP